MVPESGLTLLSAQYEKHSIVCVPGGIWVDEEQYDRFEDAGHIASLHSMSDPRLGQGPRGARVRLKAVQHHKHRPEKQKTQSHSKINSRFKLNKLKIKHLFTKFNFVSIVEICHRGRVLTSGLEISRSREPRAPLISPAAPANFCREPKDYWFLYTTTSRLAFELLLNLAPWLSCTSKKAASRAHYFICANLTRYTILQRINTLPYLSNVLTGIPGLPLLLWFRVKCHRMANFLWASMRGFWKEKLTFYSFLHYQAIHAWSSCDHSRLTRHP